MFNQLFDFNFFECKTHLFRLIKTYNIFRKVYHEVIFHNTDIIITFQIPILQDWFSCIEVHHQLSAPSLLPVTANHCVFARLSLYNTINASYSVPCRVITVFSLPV